MTTFLNRILKLFTDQRVWSRSKNTTRRIEKRRSMRLDSLLSLAWSNLWSHRSRGVLTVGGVAVGIGSIIFLLSLGFGLEGLVTNQAANFEAFTILDVPSANLKTGKINQEAINKIQDVAHIKQINPIVDTAGRVKLEDKTATTETVVVGTPEEYFALANIPVSGLKYANQSLNEVVVNSGLARLIGFNNPADIINKTILLDLVVPSDLRTADGVEGPIVKEGLKLKIVGLTDDATSPALYIPLELTDQIGIINRTSLKIKIEDRKYVAQIRKSIENIGFSTEYVGDTVAEISQVFSLFRIFLAGFGVIALFVATLGTFNTLTISLIERIREIGLLKTLGMRKRDIFKLFIIESLSIGIVGGFIGIILATTLGWGLNLFLASLAHHVGADTVKVYFSPPSLFLFTGVLAVVVGFLTGLYPAIRAIRVGPLDVLRYE